MFNPERNSVEACVKRGISLEDPTLRKVARYIEAGNVLIDEFEDRTSLIVNSNSRALMSDLNLIGCLLNEELDSGGALDKNDLTIGSGGFASGFNFLDFGISLKAALSYRFHAGNVNDQVQPELAHRWNTLILTMFEHRNVAVNGSGASRYVNTRTAEARALAAVYSGVICSGLSDFEYRLDPSGRRVDWYQVWLGKMLEAGNVSDSLIDYREDLKLGHQPLGVFGWSYLALSAAKLCTRFVLDPDTDSIFVAKTVKTAAVELALKAKGTAFFQPETRARLI